jgi:septum formation protein
MAFGGPLGSAQARLTLASTSLQRRAILEQLRIPFEVVEPTYVESDPPGLAPGELVRMHAEGKARSVHGEGRVTLGVDTAVLLDGRIYGKPNDRDDAERMLRDLSGRTHAVVSGLCLLGTGADVIAHELTDVTFRSFSIETLSGYLESEEWEGRAGAYAIQGLGGRLVERIEGDYLNVVGLPGALLVSLLERHAPNLLQTRR